LIERFPIAGNYTRKDRNVSFGCVMWDFSFLTTYNPQLTTCSHLRTGTLTKAKIRFRFKSVRT